jgi:hypothetical protein
LNIFLDSSVALAASLLETGASPEVFNKAATLGWRLILSPQVLREVRDNLADKSIESAQAWVMLRRKVILEDDELTFDWPVTFDASKDKPVLFSALACADVLISKVETLIEITGIFRINPIGCCKSVSLI